MSLPKPCNDCGRTRKLARGLCTTCYGRRQRTDTLPPVLRRTVHGRVEEVIEDVAFLAAAGDGLHEAARRTGTTAAGLEKLLVRNDLHELLALLIEQDEIPLIYLDGSRIDNRSHIRSRGPARATWKVS